jgi:hypothetical protein
MRLVSRLLWVFVLWVFPIVGCTQVTNAVQLTLSVREGLPPSQVPLGGAELCEAETTNCALSDAGGTVNIELPANRRVRWTLEKDGYGSIVTPDVTDGTFGPTSNWHLFTNEWYAENFDRLDAPYPMAGTGAIYVAVVPLLAGATFQLVDATGEKYYVDEEGNLSPDLEATTSRGIGGFVEVQPGLFQVEIGGAAQNCSPSRAWPGDEPDIIWVPVQAGYLTTTVINCPPPP